MMDTLENYNNSLFLTVKVLMADKEKDIDVATKDGQDQFSQGKLITHELRKEFEDIDAQQDQIFKYEYERKRQGSQKNTDDQRERQNSLLSRVSIKKLAKNIYEMPSSLIDTSKEIKNKLYDHRQNRH